MNNVLIIVPIFYIAGCFIKNAVKEQAAVEICIAGYVS